MITGDILQYFKIPNTYVFNYYLFGRWGVVKSWDERLNVYRIAWRDSREKCMTAADVKIAVNAHMINMQDEKFSQDAHYYAAEKEKKVGEMDADMTAKVGKITTPDRIAPETQAKVDVPSGDQSIAPNPTCVVK